MTHDMSQEEWDTLRARFQSGDTILLTYDRGSVGHQSLRVSFINIDEVGEQGFSIGDEKIPFEKVIALSLILYEKRT